MYLRPEKNKNQGPFCFRFTNNLFLFQKHVGWRWNKHFSYENTYVSKWPKRLWSLAPRGVQDLCVQRLWLNATVVKQIGNSDVRDRNVVVVVDNKKKKKQTNGNKNGRENDGKILREQCPPKGIEKHDHLLSWPGCAGLSPGDHSAISWQRISVSLASTLKTRVQIKLNNFTLFVRLRPFPAFSVESKWENRLSSPLPLASFLRTRTIIIITAHVARTSFPFASKRLFLTRK